MALRNADLAILSARFGVARFGASRFGFCPDHVEGPDNDEPGEYVWKEDKPPVTVWTLQTEFSFCRDLVGPTADYDWLQTDDQTYIIDFDDTSTRGDAAIVAWAWDFDGTGTSTLQNPSHDFDQSGEFSVTLVVTDANGLQDTYVDTVTVVEPG